MDMSHNCHDLTIAGKEKKKKKFDNLCGQSSRLRLYGGGVQVEK